MCLVLTSKIIVKSLWETRHTVEKLRKNEKPLKVAIHGILGHLSGFKKNAHIYKNFIFSQLRRKKIRLLEIHRKLKLKFRISLMKIIKSRRNKKLIL